MKASISGLPLPSARQVSSALVLDGSYPSMTHSLMFMQFGQFIAHDVSAGVVFTIGKYYNNTQFYKNEQQYFKVLSYLVINSSY